MFNSDIPQQERHRQRRKVDTNVCSIAAAILASMVTGGTSYSFGLYGGALKKSLHLSQSQLDTISSANFISGFVSWAPGMVADKFGPRFAISAGGFLSCFLLLLYWDLARGHFELPETMVVPVLSAVGLVAFMTLSLVTGGVFKTIVTTCGPGTKGSAVGAAKGYVGLGAGAYAILYQALKGSSDNALNFLPMEAFFALAAAGIPSLFLIPEKATLTRLKDATTPRHYRIIYAGLIVMGSMVVTESILALYDPPSSSSLSAASDRFLDQTEPLPPQSRHFGMAIFIVLLWFGPILSLTCLQNTHSVLQQEDDDMDDSERSDEMQDSEEDDDEEGGGGGEIKQSSDAQPAEPAGSPGEEDTTGLLREQPTDVEMSVPFHTEETTQKKDASKTAHTEAIEEDGDAEHLLHEETDSSLVIAEVESLNLFQMLGTAPAWFLLYTSVIITGSGTLLTNNMSQMVESLDLPPLTANASLSFFSVAQSASRVLTGVISEMALSWDIPFFGRGIPRPVFFVVASVIAFCAHMLLAVATTEIPFVIGATLSGVAFGMIWPTLVLVAGECFGKEHVGANYMFFDGAASAFGTLLLSKFVAQTVYEKHIHHGSLGLEGDDISEDDGSQETDDDLTCYGAACFQSSHTIVALLSLSCILTSVGLLYTTRHVYTRR